MITVELLESVEALVPEDFVNWLRPAAHGHCRAAIGVHPIEVSALVAKESGGFLQASGYVLVDTESHCRCDPSAKVEPLGLPPPKDKASLAPAWPGTRNGTWLAPAEPSLPNDVDSTITRGAVP